jgi:DNA-binding SARP family transcriptional activator
VEADRPHSRDVLAGTLWPDWPQRSALSNLRYALSNLRQAIGDRQARPAFLLITRETIQFNPASDYELDVAAFLELAKAEAVDALRQAVALYQGSFLEGFSVGDSAAFDEWTLLTREQLIQQMLRVLKRVADYSEGRGDYEQAQPYAQRQVELEPWQEEGHQQLMRVLALSGQRSAALTQYETCRRRLADELGVEPAAETTALYERIRDGRLTAPPFVSVPLAFLAEQADHAEVEHPVFVARESELAQLDKFLEKVLAGQGQVVFITGEPGSGKTALLGEFVRRAMETHADLVAANGNCNAHTGIGDPYLPFLETLQMLAADIEANGPEAQSPVNMLSASGPYCPRSCTRYWTKGQS